ncbi:MAG TPA: hypothetical protein VMT31_05365 [Methanomicrobiales archaeon]|jgi:hypothetical protein|nr:hypothetical protein [Methanomicrobiales archaeon]
MQKVLRTERLGDGVSVAWEQDGEEITSYFSFTRLIDMRVNALDVLNTPGNYGIDEKTGEIRFMAFCQPSRHQE